MTRPTASPAIWPYPHRTMAEVMRDERAAKHCPTCETWRTVACAFSRCPMLPAEAA